MLPLLKLSVKSDCAHAYVYTDLSSTSRNTQPGECVVVKMRLSIGIRGAAWTNNINVRAKAKPSKAKAFLHAYMNIRWYYMNTTVH